MVFKLSNLNSNLALTVGHLNPALNNSAQGLLQPGVLQPGVFTTGGLTIWVQLFEGRLAFNLGIDLTRVYFFCV